ncbi:MAG: hypothetical protein JO267_09680 [Alphaproteobacteria bacterium]|nr:hypothetical protein [Alphaproteobacteria bacterium]
MRNGVVTGRRLGVLVAVLAALAVAGCAGVPGSANPPSGVYSGVSSGDTRTYR